MEHGFLPCKRGLCMLTRHTVPQSGQTRVGQNGLPGGLASKGRPVQCSNVHTPWGQTQAMLGNSTGFHGQSDLHFSNLERGQNGMGFTALSLAFAQLCGSLKFRFGNFIFFFARFVSWHNFHLPILKCRTYNSS